MVKGLLGEEGKKNRPKLNNKMAGILNLSTLESKKTNKQNRNRLINTEDILMVARWEGG